MNTDSEKAESDVGLISDSHRIKKVWYREPAVLVTLTCLLVLSAITTAAEDAMLKKTRYRQVISLWKLCVAIIPVPGLYLTFFLSGYVGRKAVIVFLFLLSIISSILHTSSFQDTWVLLTFILQSLLKSGAIIMAIIGTWEYSSPKNTLTYLIVDVGVWQMTKYLATTKFYHVVLEIDSFYITVIPVLLGLVCLGWALQWPESPYWLATKGLCETIIPVPGMHLTFFLAEYVGRKPVNVLLFLLSIVASILQSISFQDTWVLLTFLVQGLFRSGTLVMALLGTLEYSSKKNKLTYLIVNVVVWRMTEYLPRTGFYKVVLEIDSFYMTVLPVLLGLVSLGWALQWPESPYWLASKELCETIIPVPGMYLTFFLAENVGRKPVIVLLFLLSIVASILQAISFQDSWVLLTFIVQGLFRSGTIVMALLGTWEYSSKKNKLTYLIVNMVVWQITAYLPTTGFYKIMLEIDSFYMTVIPVLLGLACLGWALQFPESPSWLTSKDKAEESRMASQWLYGDEKQSQPKPPSENFEEPPKLYSLSLLMIIITVNIYKTALWYKTYSAANTSSDFISNEFKTGLLVCSVIFVASCTAVIFNNIKQKFIILTLFSLIAVFYIFGYLSESFVASLYRGAHPILFKALNRVYVYVDSSGPFLLCFFFLVRKVPKEYRTFAYVLISYIQLGLAFMVLMFAILVSYD